LFTFREAGKQGPLVTMSHPSLSIVAPPPCLPLDIKDLLKENGRLLDEGRLFDEGVLLKGLLEGDC
jgi:hypothetical protein